MTSHGAVSTSNQRPYQGYPYSNPVVIDVPSLEPNTQQWQHLPRKPAASNIERKPKRPESKINLPKDDDIKDIVEESPAGRSQDIIEPGSNDRISGTSNDYPTIYVDGPSNPYSSITERLNSDDTPRNDANNSGIHFTNASPSQDLPVTIYFNQYDNVITRDNDSEASNSPEPNRRPLDQTFRKQAMLYGNQEVPSRLPTRNDGFDLSPLPICEFPAPPPPYTEFQETRTEADPPRTQVITPAATDSSDSKQVICQYCGARVRTIMLRQVGALTHVIAMSFMVFCLIPCMALVYFVDWFKYRNHYCARCSRLVGYEVPALCQKLVFVSATGPTLTTQL